jgi:hypothetical protein
MATLEDVRWRKVETKWLKKKSSVCAQNARVLKKRKKKDV